MVWLNRTIDRPSVHQSRYECNHTTLHLDLRTIFNIVDCETGRLNLMCVGSLKVTHEQHVLCAFVLLPDRKCLHSSNSIDDLVLMHPTLDAYPTISIDSSTNISSAFLTTIQMSTWVRSYNLIDFILLF